MGEAIVGGRRYLAEISPGFPGSRWEPSEPDELHRVWLVTPTGAQLEVRDLDAIHPFLGENILKQCCEPHE